MGFVKRFPDGSVYDPHHGHRTAAVVAAQKAAGTYTEPELSEEEKRNILSGLLLLAVLLVLGGIVFLGIQHAKHTEANNVAIVNAVNATGKVEVLNNDYDGGEDIYLSDDHEVIYQCEVKKNVSTEDGVKTLVFCQDQAITGVTLPYAK